MCARQVACPSHIRPQQQQENELKTKMTPCVVSTRMSQPERVMSFRMQWKEGPIKCIFLYSFLAAFVRNQQQSWRSSVVSGCNVLGNFIAESVKNNKNYNLCDSHFFFPSCTLVFIWLCSFTRLASDSADFTQPLMNYVHFERLFLLWLRIFRDGCWKLINYSQL